jgi:hypothetical protein
MRSNTILLPALLLFTTCCNALDVPWMEGPSYYEQPLSTKGTNRLRAATSPQWLFFVSAEMVNATEDPAKALSVRNMTGKSSLDLAKDEVVKKLIGQAEARSVLSAVTLKRPGAALTAAEARYMKLDFDGELGNAGKQLSSYDELFQNGFLTSEMHAAKCAQVRERYCAMRT